MRAHWLAALLVLAACPTGRQPDKDLSPADGAADRPATTDTARPEPVLVDRAGTDSSKRDVAGSDLAALDLAKVDKPQTPKPDKPQTPTVDLAKPKVDLPTPDLPRPDLPKSDSCIAACNGPVCGAKTICGASCSGDGNEPCPGVPAETWRCVNSTSAFPGKTISQVCRGGVWLTYHPSPQNCAGCCGPGPRPVACCNAAWGCT